MEPEKNDSPPPPPEKKGFSWKRLIPIFVLIILGVIAYFLGLQDYFTFEMLKENRKTLVNFVDQHWLITPLLYVLIYIVVVALSIPGATFLTVIGGFIFRQPFSTIYVVVGASVGACIIFLAAKTALGDYLRQKAGSLMQKMEKGFRENAISYMFFLRLVPIFPFWLVNLAPAFFGVPLFTFFWTTFVGIIPGSFVFAQAGSGLGAILDTSEEFSLKAVLNWELRIAFIALGVFALIPILIKKLRKKKQQ